MGVEVITFGCRLNTFESEVIAREAGQAGLDNTIVINSCAVTNEAVAQFCSTTYGVTFPVLDRVMVNGRRAHPLYTELKKTKDLEGKAGRVTWNFEKFVVLPGGEVHRFRPRTLPDDPAIIDVIESHLPR